MQVHVHPRVSERHPEISVSDVERAWTEVFVIVQREGEGLPGPVLVGLGDDGHGRTLEMAGSVLQDGSVLVYHVMTPPSRRSWTSSAGTGEGGRMASYTLKDGTTLTDEAIEEMAGRFEAGEFPGHTTKVVVGRPRISRGELKTVTVKVPASVVVAFDRKATEGGETRSQRLRELMEGDIADA